MEVKPITLKQLQLLQNSGKLMWKNDPKINLSNIQKTMIKSIQKSFISKEQIETEPVKIIQDSHESKLTWSKRATCALLSAYEAQDIETDNSKKIKNFGNLLLMISMHYHYLKFRFYENYESVIPGRPTGVSTMSPADP